MAEEKNPDTSMDAVDKKVLKLAALIDATIRFHCADIDLSLIHISEPTRPY